MSALSRPGLRSALSAALLIGLTGGAFALGTTAGSDPDHDAAPVGQESSASPEPSPKRAPEPTPEPSPRPTAEGFAPVLASAELPAFDDCDSLVARMQDLAEPYLADALAEDDRNSYSYPGAADAAAPAADAAAPAADAAAPAADASSAAAPAAGSAPTAAKAAKSAARAPGSDPEDAVGPGATGTNLQEAAVDEPDTAKTDGKLIVSLRGGKIRVFDVTAEQPVLRGKLNLRNRGFEPSELLLDGDRVLVIGRTRGQSYDGDSRRWSPTGDDAALALIDVSKVSSPRLIATEEITGKVVSSRLSGGAARIVVSSSPDLPLLDRGYRSSGRYNRDVVRSAKAADWLPSRTVRDGAGELVSSARPLVDCADVRYPALDAGTDMLSVVTFDLGREDALTAANSVAVVSSGDLVYASPDRLYLATTQGGWGNGSTEFPGMFTRPDGPVTTGVHEFDITHPGSTTYLSSGTVAGFIPGQWAMSERDGYLRVVTTTQEPWLASEWSDSSTESHVVVLRPSGKRLVQVGRLGGIGHGEAVKAVRWFDEIAAVVTFRQVDPLYLVDLTRPDRPVLRGKLKIPGYSAYLHPIGDDRLLGLGEDVDRWGNSNGLQFSAFDIKNAAKPSRTDDLSYGPSSWSTVTSDPRGFVYLPERRTAVIPAEVPAYGNVPGLISVRVGTDGSLHKGGVWPGKGWQQTAEGYRGVFKILSLPGGRLATIDSGGLNVLDADTMALRGSVRYPHPPQSATR